MKAYAVLFTLSIVQTHASFNKNFGSVALQAKIGILPKRHPITTEDEVATKNTVHMIKNFKNSMNSDEGLIPVLDPYIKVDIKPIKFGINTVFTGNVHLKKLHVAGAKNFSLISTRVYINDQRIEFNVTVPKIVINVDFKSQGTFTFFPISANGHLKANLLDINISGALGANRSVINGSEVFQLVSATVFIKARNLHVLIEGMDRITRSSLNTIWHNKKHDLTLFALEQVMEEVNSILKLYTFETVLSCLKSYYTCLIP